MKKNSMYTLYGKSSKEQKKHIYSDQELKRLKNEAEIIRKKILKKLEEKGQTQKLAMIISNLLKRPQ